MTKEEKREKRNDWYWNKGGREYLKKWRREHGFKKVVIKSDD